MDDRAYEKDDDMNLKDFVTYKSARLDFIYDDERYHELCHFSRSKKDRKASNCLLCLNPRKAPKPKRILVKSRMDYEDFVETTCDSQDARVTKRDIIMVKKTVTYEKKGNSRKIDFDPNKPQDITLRIEKTRKRRCKCQVSHCIEDERARPKVEKPNRKLMKENERKYAASKKREKRFLKSILSKYACENRPFRFFMKRKVIKKQKDLSDCSALMSECFKQLEALEKPSKNLSIDKPGPSKEPTISRDENSDSEDDLHRQLKLLCAKIMQTISKSCPK